MKHSSGIEVYLKPAGEDGAHLKYPELEWDPWPTSTAILIENESLCNDVEPDNLRYHKSYHERYMQCFVPHIDNGFEIVVRFTDDFDIFTASAINVGIAVGCDAPYTSSDHLKVNEDEVETRLERATRFHYTLVQKSQAMGQQIIFALPDSEHFRLSKYRETTGFWHDEINQWHLYKKAYWDLVNPGTITVVVQRGNADWLDEADKPRKEQSKLGLANPRMDRLYKERSFAPLKSRNGDKIRFEFRPRSLHRLARVERTLFQMKGERPPMERVACEPNRRALIPDEGYATALRTGKSFRRYMEASWPRRLARAKQPKAIRKPATCQCPVKHHRKAATAQRRQRKRPAKDLKSLGPGDDRAAKKMRLSSPQEHMTSPAAGPASMESQSAEAGPDMLPRTETQAKETEARTCGTCQKYKRPPRGKKFSWAAAVQKWVYVHETAPDSFPPEDDGAKINGGEAESSKEEAETSEEEAETSEEEAETSEEEAETSEEEAETSDDESETSYDEAEQSEEEEAEFTDAEQSEADEAETSDDESESDQHLDHAGGGEATRATPGEHTHTSSIGHFSDGAVPEVLLRGESHGLGSDLPEEKSSKAKGVHSAPVASTSMQESQRPFSNGARIDEGPHSELPLVPDQVDGPGPASSSATGRSRALNRSIVDMSEDVVEGNPEVKHEKIREFKQEPGTHLADDSDEEELRAKLDQNRLKLQAVELRMEAAELERKLKQKAAAKRRPKLKREVIELD